jgi:hypothetical protein
MIGSCLELFTLTLTTKRGSDRLTVVAKPQGLKPRLLRSGSGTTEVMP